MCRQTANGLICIPPADPPTESNDDLLQTITDLIEKNSRPCVNHRLISREDISNFLRVQISPSLANEIVTLTQRMYSMIPKNYRTIDEQEKPLNDDTLALFLVSTLR